MNQKQLLHSSKLSGQIVHCSTGRLRFKLSGAPLPTQLLLEATNRQLTKQVKLSYKPRSQRHLATYPPSANIEQELIRCFGLSRQEKYADSTGEKSENTLNEKIQTLESLLPLKAIAQETSLYCIGRFLIPAPLKPLWILWKAYPFITKGAKSLINKELDVELLQALSLCNSILGGKFNAALDLSLVLQLNNHINEKLVQLKQQHSAHLHWLDQGAIWRDDQGLPTPALREQLQKDDHVIVYAGHRIPIDGYIHKGVARIHRSFPLGAPETRNSCNGEAVLAGEMLESGQLTIRAKHSAKDSRYANIVRKVNTAQNQQNAMQWEAEQLDNTPGSKATSLTKTLLSLCQIIGGKSIAQSLLMLTGTSSIDSQNAYQQALNNAIIEASKYGALLNNTPQFETLAKADTIIFDISAETSTTRTTDKAAGIQQAVQALRRSAVDTVILIGAEKDDRNIRQIGVSKSYNKLSGEAKLKIIHSLKEQGKSIVLISDACDNAPTRQTEKQLNELSADLDLLILLNSPNALEDKTASLLNDARDNKQLILLDTKFEALAKIRTLAKLAQQKSKNHLEFASASNTVLNALLMFTNTPIALSLFLQKSCETALTLSSLQILLKDGPDSSDRTSA